jgi:hypothetical protein
VSCEQNCAGMRQELSTQNTRLRHIAKAIDFDFRTTKISAPIQCVLSVMNSVLSLEGKRMCKRAILTHCGPVFFRLYLS